MTPLLDRAGGGGGLGRRPAPGAAPSSLLFPLRFFALPSALKMLVLGDDYDHSMSEGDLPDRGW